MVSHPLWQIAVGCDLVALALQVIALHLGALAIVQPILLASLLFSLILRRLGSHHRIDVRQLGWAAVLVVALGAFVLVTTRTRSASAPVPDALMAGLAGIVGAVTVSLCVLLGRRAHTAVRSAAFNGVAIGVIYASTAALIKDLTNIAVRHPLQIVVSWPLYAVIVLGVLGVVLSQIAFQSGPLTASLPATAAVDPLLSVVVGVVVFDERLRTGGAAAVALVLLLAVLALSSVKVARSSGVFA